MNKKLNSVPSAGTTDEQRTAADLLPSASVEANPMLSADLSIIEGNKLIAKWDGKGRVHPNDLKYHTSWDWMMPALDKFINKSTRPIESRDLNEYRNYCNRLYNLVTDFNIRDVFNCLVEAIKWLRSVGSR